MLDLNHGLQFVPMATIEGSDDIGDLPRRRRRRRSPPGPSRSRARRRMDLAGANAAICRKLMPQLLERRAGRDPAAGHQPRRRDHLRHAEAQRPAATQRVLGSGHGAGQLAIPLPDRPAAAASPCRTSTPTSPASTATARSRCGARASIGNIPLHEWAVPGARQADRPRPHRDLPERQGRRLPDHRGQGRDQLRDRPGDGEDPRGNPARTKTASCRSARC